jgi:hypothetical protein
MQNRILLAFVTLLLIPAGRGWCQESGGPLGDPLPPPVHDPSLSNSHRFSPSLTHAGVADTGPALSGVNKSRSGGPAAGCSALSPCAVPSPALDHAVASHAG